MLLLCPSSASGEGAGEGMCWVKPKACLVPCSPCIAVIPSDWGKPDSLPTGLLTAVQAGKDKDGGVFAVVNMGRNGWMSA